MAFELVRGYVQLASGLGELTKARAMEAAQGLLTLPGADEVGKRAVQVSVLADQLLEAARANRESLIAMVRSEVESALGRSDVVHLADLELARTALAALTREVDDLRRTVLAEASRGPLGKALPGAAAAAISTIPRPAARPVPVPDVTVPVAAVPDRGTAEQPAAKKAAAKKATAKKTTAKKTTAKKTTAKKTTAKKATAKKAHRQDDHQRPRQQRAPPPRQATAKKTAAKKATAKKTTAKKSTAKRSTAKRATANKATAEASAPAEKATAEAAATRDERAHRNRCRQRHRTHPDRDRERQRMSDPQQPEGTAPAAPKPTPPGAPASPGETGDVLIDAALQDLEDAAPDDLDAQIEAGQRVHRTLQSRLSDLGGQ